MGDKVVIVVSFDEPQNEAEYKETIGQALESLKGALNHTSSRHVWMGVKDQGEAVLNVIGVST